MTGAKIIEFHPSESFFKDEMVYLCEEHYNDINARILEIPRFGWRVKAVLEELAIVKYEDPNLKLFISLILKTKYLKKEV